jgi:hypothetical protein
MAKVATKSIEVRVYGNLNDFIRPQLRHVGFTHGYAGNPTVKDLIESVGIPHVEVCLIVVNGEAVAFDYHPAPGDRMAVYPRFYAVPLGDMSLCEACDPRFILDVHLGKLARYLRIMGFDTLYRTDFDDREILRLSNAENRIILTRDLGILRNGLARLGYYLRSDQPRVQLKEVMEAFALHSRAMPFSRCSICNGEVERIDRLAASGLVRSSTFVYYHNFFRCKRCGQIYWEGSHYHRIVKFIDRNLN